MSSLYRRGAARLLAVTILFVAACNSNEALPVDPVPEPRPDLTGSIYVLQEVSGLPAPFLVSDHTYAGDGARTRIWIVADTLRFGPNRSVSRHRSIRQLDETPGYPGNTADWMTYRNGLFGESDERVIGSTTTYFRHKPFVDAIAASDRAGFLFMEGTPAERRFVTAAEALGTDLERVRTDDFVVYVPDRPLPPADLPAEARP